MDDTSSRQAAIDAVCKAGCGSGYCGIPCDEVKALRGLPSAQPEITYCKDCKFTDGEKPIADGRYWCVLNGGFMYFCSDAERR